MTNETVYISNDGKRFHYADDCMYHEMCMELYAKGIVLYDKSGETTLDPNLAYEMEIGSDDVTDIMQKLVDYFGSCYKLPDSKGKWAWQTGEENRLVCQNCSYHCFGTGGWTCQYGRDCNEGMWVKIG